MHFSLSSQLSETLDIARYSNIPVLLTGKEGIGKSEFLTEHANIRDLELTVLDLSLFRLEDFTAELMKPTLMGLPDSNSSKKHILVVKKLNQCSQDIQKISLRLLTNRQLHSYRLPQKIFLVACMTTDDEGHCLSTIDSSILSKFLTIPIKTDLQSWLRWSEENFVHPIIQAYVEQTLFPFEKISPRTYVHISHILKSMDLHTWNQTTINSIIESILGHCADHFLFFMREWLSESHFNDHIYRAEENLQIVKYNFEHEEDYEPSYAIKTVRKL